MLKAKLALSGINEPLVYFRTVHDLLNVVEFIWLENLTEEKSQEVYEFLYKIDARRSAAFSPEAEMQGFKSLKGNLATVRAGASPRAGITSRTPTMSRNSPAGVARGRRR